MCVCVCVCVCVRARICTYWLGILHVISLTSNCWKNIFFSDIPRICVYVCVRACVRACIQMCLSVHGRAGWKSTCVRTIPRSLRCFMFTAFTMFKFRSISVSYFLDIICSAIKSGYLQTVRQAPVTSFYRNFYQDNHRPFFIPPKISQNKNHILMEKEKFKLMVRYQYFNNSTYWVFWLVTDCITVEG